MSALSRYFIDFNIVKKSPAAVFETAAVTLNVPRIKKPVFFGAVISLDSPFLIKENVFPKLAAAHREKFKPHLMLPLLIA